MSDSMTDSAGKETTQKDSDNVLCSQQKQDHYSVSYPCPLCHRGTLKQKGIDEAKHKKLTNLQQLEIDMEQQTGILSPCLLN